MTNNKTALLLLNMIRNGGNPQQLALSMLSQNANNPVLKNLLSMAQSGDTKGIEQVARNLLSSQGYDFDKEFASFKQDLGI